MNRFAGKIALITGGTSGMGLATARRFLDEGASVVITGRSRAGLDKAVAELGAERVTAVVADTSDLDDIDRLMSVITEEHGRIDVLFANAGVGGFANFAEVTPEFFDEVVGVNFKGLFFTVQKAVALMGTGSSIVLNSSWTINRGMSIATVYSATKAAVHNLARTLSADLGPRGIRVNSISPGYIATRMAAEAMDDETRAAAAAETVSGRLGTSEEIAGTVAFLASADAAYVNGQDLIVDGGLVGAIPVG
ncbi:SDR family NAD(P)-dependent oxidoreductase [Phytomonospora endophytica]|uniref:NAD(P)-dependent dehydrogenase (Short-subunit alcohol dehydrogenase family) n=1 Tax=Phytomonospora endophytica TaxID=714109 RepID=A0A841FYG9_9ACTN|nr:SDR family oxidoreductase [Phytomonospora endophytica]MBB6038397.1 NAD(P)-dependent dehydrogenase (short-subunit alcohol dehydrogenase family) [Phytomonospora endophytica]GIG64327.1 oxidoreductase [Phytomonospora endophytica]